MNFAPPGAATNALLRPPKEPLALRIRGGPRDGQRLNIFAPKCSIGAAAGCTLRLKGRGIQPVHCAVLRGGERTVVRRWSADTRLNGADFLDAVLKPGDLLSVGPVQFEVLPAESEASEPDEELDTERHSLSAAQREFDEQRGQWDEQRRRAQADLDWREAGLEGQLKQLTAAKQGFQELQQESATASRELAGARAQLASEQNSLDQQRAEVSRQREALDQEIAAFNERQAQVEREQTAVGELRDMLNARSEELDSRQAELAKERLALEQQFDRQRQSLADEISAQRDALWKELAAGKSQRETLDRDLQSLDAQREQFALERNAGEQQRRQQESELAVTETQYLAEQPVVDEPAEDPSALSTVRFLNRYGEDDENPEPPDQDVVQQRPAETVFHSPPAEGAEEESVEDYMQRLMQRLSGGSAAPAASQAPPHSANTRPQTASVSKKPDIAPEQPPAAAVKDIAKRPLDESKQFVRRANSVLPSKLADMRDLANISARSAIAQHQLRSGKQSLFTSLLLATLSIGIGLALFLLAADLGGVTFLAGMAALAAGLYFLVQFANIMRNRAAAAKAVATRTPPQATASGDGADVQQATPTASDG